jgi:hypothetical protein
MIRRQGRCRIPLSFLSGLRASTIDATNHLMTQCVHTDAELTHVPTQDCPTSKLAQIQRRQWFERNQTGSVTFRQLDQIGVGANISDRINEQMRVLEDNNDAVAELLVDLIARWTPEEEKDPED